MAVNLSPYGGVGAQFLDNAGNVLTGGKIYTYAAGTTTPQVAYGNSAGTTPLSNPIILDAAGRVPTGEIWLTDGLVYKFVLKDSNDVLIATYDYISGINSNFVAYTNQQEIQTATAGQTVFNLTTVSYQPGTNSLSVFVDGVNQYGPGSSYAYLETDSDTVTFVSGLHVGAEVKFTTSQLNSSGGNDAYNVSYLPPFTNAVATNVGDKLAQTISFKDFGAVGDGVTNDAAAVLAALNSGANVVDGGGKTYKLNSNIAPTCQNIVIQNATFDISSITTGGSAIAFIGTQATGVALTSDILTGSNSIAVGNTTGFADDDYAWLSSTTIFDTATTTTLGQIVKIKSVSSSTAMTLYEDVLYDFTTVASASIAKLTPKQNITLRNVNFIGADTGIQTAVDFEKCANVLVDDCNFDYVDYTSIVFDRCVNATVTNTSMRYARAVGLSYGISIGNGCYSVKVANCYGEDQRHLVTVGDNSGVNLFVSVTNCHAAAQRDAGLDSHPAGDFILFDGNTIELAAAQSDGIICQGLNAVITNNIIVGNITTGIRHQLLPEISTGSSVITGNSIENTGNTASTDTAIYVEQSSGSGSVMQGVVISNNRIDGAIEQGIYVFANTGNVKNVTITGNVLTSDASIFACYLRAAATYSLEDFAITGNIFKCSGVSNIYLIGTTAPNVLNGTISGNTIKGGTNGIRMIQTQDVVETGNYNTGVTRKVFVDTGSSEIWMDRRTSSVVTMTNSTYTVLDQDEFLIANRITTITMTLPSASAWPGRELNIKTIQAQAVDSAASNVVPVGDSVAGTSILPATDGAWALLKSNGADWVIMARG